MAITMKSDFVACISDQGAFLGKSPTQDQSYLDNWLDETTPFMHTVENDGGLGGL